MRIHNISVKGLFGLFDHSVPLRLEDRITIIHGANGLGKTALLRLLNGFFNSKNFELGTIPFSNFEIRFDDGSRIIVQKSAENRKDKRNVGRPRTGLTFIFSRRGVKQEEYHFDVERVFGKDGLRRRMIDLEGIMPALERVAVDKWQYLPTGETFSYYDAIVRFQDHLPNTFVRDMLGEIEAQPEWLTELKNSVNVHFIESQRLVTLNERRSRYSKVEGPFITPAVQVYSEEITRAIKDTLTEYAELSQSLDRTFPARLMWQSREQNLSSDELRERLTALESKRQGLQATGLLEEEQDVRFDMRELLDSTTQKVLSVYVLDVERKLSIFDELAAKIDLMKQIVDNRFLHKRMVMNREEGFLFTTKEGQPLAPTQLSSGEQNELVLLYELLFKVKPGSLILIDEPEISLHIAWQQQFLRDLEQIIRLSKFDALIATHSPQIIHDRWDLTVELQGPREHKK